MKSYKPSWLSKILCRILVEVTGKPRYFPDFEWSELWTHNIFRFLGMIFGEYYGIRPSVASLTDGRQIAYTLEAQCALFEVWVRSLKKSFAFNVILIPQLQLAGMTRGGLYPYRFAIAFDATSGVQTNTSNSLSHTCTGSNLLLAVEVTGDLVTDTLTDLTYNSVSMFSSIVKVNYSTDRWSYLGVLANPSSGANNITETGSTFRNIAGVSYTGCAQTGQPDSKASKDQSTGGPFTTQAVTTTVVAANCWLVGMTRGSSGMAAGSGTTLRGTPTGAEQMADSNATVGTGSQSLNYTYSSGNMVGLVASIAPVAAAATAVFTPQLLTQNVG